MTSGFQLVETIVDHLVTVFNDQTFTEFSDRYIYFDALKLQLMRLFIGEPVWAALNRPQESHPARQEYVKNVTGNTGFALAAH